MGDLTREEIRLKYSGLLEKVNKDDRNDLVGFGNEKFYDYLKEANQLLQQVKETPEFALDAKLLVQLIHLLKEKAGSLDTNAEQFDGNEFADCLVQEIMGGSDGTLSQDDGLPLDAVVDYSFKIGHLLNRAHGLKCMIGSFDLDAVPPPKKEPVRRERQQIAKEKRPEKTVEAANAEPTTEDHVRHIHKCLAAATKAAGKPVNYFKFLLDPSSFGKSVENIFHFSFLVRDTSASVDLDKNGIPVIDIVQPADQDTDEEAKQFIMSLDMDYWEELVETFLPDHPPAMIPP